MNKQNIDPNENENKQGAVPNQNKTGLDAWNERLDNNLEPEQNGNEAADENAENYSDLAGSGDQSDKEDGT
jgi:hypothetical protein